MKKALFFPLQVSFCTIGCLFTSSGVAHAQVTPDGTLDTQVNQNGNVAEITGGETRAGNLFHSFQDFSVGTGNEAFFNNANDISNIFSRVTGGNISNIDGLIRANGSANLFLVNPAGIMFGNNARLDIGGSFLGTTADSILFEEGVFSATDLENPPLLTVNAPIGLGFRDNPGDITVQGSTLTVSPGQNLSLLGGEINIDNASLFALGGKINLASLLTEGTVVLNPELNFDLSDLSTGDISLSNSANLNVNGDDGGEIAVNARNLTLTQGSVFSAGINSDTATADAQAGDITVNAAETVTLNSGSLFRNNVSSVSSGNAGDIEITATNLSLNDESRLSSISQGQGNAGSIILDVSESISLSQAGEFKSQILENGVGNTTGDININTDSLTLESNSAIFTSILGEGDAGDINIVAGDRITLDNSVFQARVASGGIGDSGNIDITTGSLLLQNTSSGRTSQILSDTAGEGDAGSISITALNDVSLVESSFFLTQVESGGVGNAGDISITTTNLSLSGNSPENPASLITNSNGIGNAGNINIAASGSITFNSNSSLLSQLSSGAVGTGGDITVSADSLTLNQANWITNTRGEGNAGGITIDVANQIGLNQGSLILSQVQEGGNGDAGDININSGSLELTNSLIIADSSDLGSAGDINITVDGTINLQGFPEGSDEFTASTEELPSAIITGLNENINEDTRVVDSAGQGNAGSINITASELILTDLASVSSSVEGTTEGDGGTINLNVGLLSLSNNAAVGTFTSSESNAGSINVNGQTLELFSGGKLITVTDGNGNAGTINLNITDNITIDNNLAAEAPTFTFNEPIVNELQGQTGLFANATNDIDGSTGNGGNIFIGQDLVAPSTDIGIFNGSQVTADGGIGGDAGNIQISANSLTLDGNAVIVAETSSPQGANINLQIGENIYLDKDSLISAKAVNAGNGGNININANFIVAFPNGNNDILASAEQGQGGNINIKVESLFGIAEGALNDDINVINASSEVSGLDGTVTIDTPDPNSVQGTSDLPINVVEPDQTVANSCQADRQQIARSTFSILGKGGVPQPPDAPLSSRNIMTNGEINPTSTIPQPLETSRGKIQPARGIKVTESGQIILTAYRTNNSGQRLPEVKRNCGV